MPGASIGRDSQEGNTMENYNEHIRSLINSALELPEYQRKQIILALVASMLGDMALTDAMAIAKIIRVSLANCDNVHWPDYIRG